MDECASDMLVAEFVELIRGDEEIRNQRVRRCDIEI